MIRRAALVALAAAAVGGCSLLVQFDPETQPCDAAGACLPGYACSDAGLCTRDPDAGLAFDSGTPDACPGAFEAACTDGLDDDCDGQVDCADPDCAGLVCDDDDLCTAGERCAGGACAAGTRVTCNTPPAPCLAAQGTCEPTTGRCSYAPLADGIVCGAGESTRCCSGSCINTSVNVNHCGGCGLRCGDQATCQAVAEGGCGTTPPVSGRCLCSATAPCPGGQTCLLGACVATAPAQCARGQRLGADGGACGAYCRY